MPKRPPRSIVDSALAYLAGLERAARLKNRRREYQHFEDAWAILHRAFYGHYEYPAVPVKAVPFIPELRVPMSEKKWFQEMQATPLRRVIKTAVKGDRCIVTLECRHRVESFCPDTRKHVRCKQCRKLIKLNASASHVRAALDRIQKRGA